MDPTDFHSREKNTIKVNGVHQQKKEIHTGLKLLEGEYMITAFSFIAHDSL